MIDLDNNDSGELEGLVHFYIRNITEEGDINYLALKIEDVEEFETPMYSGLDNDLSELLGCEELTVAFNIVFQFYEFEQEILDQEGDLKYLGEYPTACAYPILRGRGLEYLYSYMLQCNEELIEQQKYEGVQLPEKSVKDYLLEELVNELHLVVGNLFCAQGYDEDQSKHITRLRELCHGKKYLLNQLDYLLEDMAHFGQKAIPLAEKRLNLMGLLMQDKFEECARLKTEIEKIKQE